MDSAERGDRGCSSMGDLAISLKQDFPVLECAAARSWIGMVEVGQFRAAILRRSCRAAAKSAGEEVRLSRGCSEGSPTLGQWANTLWCLNMIGRVLASPSVVSQSASTAQVFASPGRFSEPESY